MFIKLFRNLNLALLILNIFFIQDYLVRINVFGYPTNLQEILIFTQIILFLFATTFEKNLSQTFNNIKKHWIGNTFVLMTAVSLLTVDITDNIYFIRHLRFLCVAVIFSFIFIETLKSEKSRIEAIKTMGIGAITFGIFSVIYNLLGYNLTHDFRLLGPLDAAVYLSFYLAPFLIFFTIQFFEHRKKSDLIFAILSTLLIIATRSIGTIIGTFLVLTIYFSKKSSLDILKSKLAKAILTITAIIIICTTFYTKILPAFQTNYSSLNERQEIWQTSIHLFKDPLNFVWGIGFGQFQNEYATNAKEILGRNPLDYYVLQPHNIFLLFIFQYGILGLLFLFACIVRIVKNLKKPIKNFDIRIISNFIILYFLFHGMIDTPFFKNDLLFLLILFLEIGLGHKDKRLS